MFEMPAHFLNIFLFLLLKNACFVIVLNSKFSFLHQVVVINTVELRFNDPR